MLKFIHDSAMQWLSLGLSSGLELITSQLKRKRENGIELQQQQQYQCLSDTEHSWLQQIFIEDYRWLHYALSSEGSTSQIINNQEKQQAIQLVI